MWIKDEVMYPRFLRSIFWMIILHYVFLHGSLLLLKTVSFHPLNGIAEWLRCLFHWKSEVLLCILSMSIAAFGAISLRFSAVEKHISSTRFERICRALSPYCLQHIFATMCLGGIAAYSYDCLFHNFHGQASFIDSYLSSANDFEQSFIVGHGCFTGLMFSLKYFICNLYLLKFSLHQGSKVFYIKHQIYDQVKDSFFCVIKAIHWYYLVFILFGSPLKILTFLHLGSQHSENETTIYSYLNPTLFLNTVLSGMLISFVWSLYLLIFNALLTEHHVFPIKMPLKDQKMRTLESALSCQDFAYLKYLAVMDLRILAQYDAERRRQIFDISQPGGHPRDWKAISGICISSLQDFVYKLNEYTFAVAAASQSKVILPNGGLQKNVPFQRNEMNGYSENMPHKESLSDKICRYLRQKPSISYFFDELPNAKLMKLFASSQPFVWIADALGFLVSVSYTEDTYGVVQHNLPEIIRLLLDLKIAEEKMPVGLVGIRTYVRDPQGRYEHIHQRISLKTTVNTALSNIAHTFREDIKGIDLPEEYQRYLLRYLERKT